MTGTWRVSIRRACGLLKIAPKTYRYRSRRPGQAIPETRIQGICATRVRYGFRHVHDQLATGGKIRILTLLDTYLRFAHAVDARAQYRADNVVATLEAVRLKVGYPKTIHVDQGTELVSRDLDLWAYTHNVVLDFSRPGKPTDNAFVEAFNGRLRAECLNAHWFMTLADAREKLECWFRDIQRGETAWSDREQGPDLVTESRWRYQPASG